MIGLLYGAQKRSIYDIPTKAQQQESKNNWTELLCLTSVSTVPQNNWK